ncbi:DUF2087 domain-containing protein [Vannielia litorea]|uniref:DUF2087 domain-containing protein n=1 Tax=Vannielia litorea TaxID=1217970 RepID=UPI001BCD0538|nr:DUF2087 domain-containing protein [Vannielia litorea]MBS8228316.1 DUF2087 domain-containing protein [Vannielia litorea]
MPRSPLPLTVPDLSAFARALARQLDTPPPHQSLLKMLARAAGFRNHQHMVASGAAEARLATPPEAPADHRRVERALAQWDATGRLRQWPARRAVQELCLWALWARLPAETTLHERDVNGALNHAHLFDDAALLRRSLIGMGLLSRNRDGSDYRRAEKAPPPEARALIRHLSTRAAAPSPARTGSRSE